MHIFIYKICCIGLIGALFAHLTTPHHHEYTSILKFHVSVTVGTNGEITKSDQKGLFEVITHLYLNQWSQTNF